MEENFKLKKLQAVFELKKKIEKDLGREFSENKKREVKNDRVAYLAQKSYNLDFSGFSSIDDLYKLDFSISDKTLAGIMENSKFSTDMRGITAYLNENFQEALNIFSKSNEPESMYNTFMVLMRIGSLKDALEEAVKLKNVHPLSSLGYLALAHVLFFLEDPRWEESFKLYIAMSKDQIADFVWKIFNNSTNVKFLRTDQRKYLLDIGMFDFSNKTSMMESLSKRICEKSYNPCSFGFCDVMKSENGEDLPPVKNDFCVLERYAHALKMYVGGNFSGAIKMVPKIRDPEFLYLEALCHFSMDESNGFNSAVEEILKLEPQSTLFLSLSNERVKILGRSVESSALLKVKLSTLRENYYDSLRKIMFEFARLKDTLPTKVNFSLKFRKYHVVRMFFGYRSCKGVYGHDKK